MAVQARTATRREEPARTAASRPGARPSTTPGIGRPAPDRTALRVLGERELALRARRRHVSRLIALSAAVVVAALLVVAGAQALVAERQVRLDGLQQELASAVSRNQSLDLSRATLSAPSRVLGVAERQLKMVSPGTVVYLKPIDPGPSVAQVAARTESVSQRAGAAHG
ncbi:MAG: hypothetical protein JWO62_747 [Acidimicrobiaceae bacterium]|jgi:cell division protein FtsL|nr:hypothetical protein [Acidimicrobiaceae bacterium]